MKELLFSLKPVNAELLHQEILAVIPPLLFSGVSVDRQNIRIIVADSITSEQEGFVAVVVVNHNGALLTQGQQDEVDRVDNVVDMKSRLDASGLRSKSPQQIYTQVQNQIDAWANIADMQADLREWIPLIAAAVVWMVSKKDV